MEETDNVTKYELIFLLTEMMKGFDYLLKQPDEYLRICLNSMNNGMVGKRIRDIIEHKGN
jgi:hypothetical protein